MDTILDPRESGDSREDRKARDKRRNFKLRFWEVLVTCFTVVMVNVLVAAPNFIRPPRFRISAVNGCLNNLRQIDGAKEQFTLEH